MTRYIFHISDIHIADGRIKNLLNSFNKLISDILKLGASNSILVVVGDIFENKTHITTNEICIFKSMMQRLHEHNIQTIIIPGNHDFNINKLGDTSMSDSGMYSPTAIDLLIGEYTNVVCLTYSQVYQPINTGVDFYVLSIIDNLIPEIDRHSPNIKIALFHDAVNGALYDNGSTIEGERFSCGDFDKYDITMLGDIHKPQFLSPTVAYCGSFVQKNRGEGLEHGYILWDMNTKTGAHVFIPMIDVFIKALADNNKCMIPKLLPGQIVKYVSLIYKNCTDEAIADFKEQLITSYGFINNVQCCDVYQTSPITAPTAPIDTQVGSINHEQSILTLLKNEKPEFIQRIVSHHQRHIQNHKELNFCQYKLNYMTWSNLLCYGENNFIDFRNYTNSIVLLNGQNMAGKSSVIDILIRILFNECERGYKHDIVNKTKKSGNVKLSLSVGADEYIIEQMLEQAEAHNKKHSLYKNGENITCQSINDTYKYLRETVGIGDYRDFINITTALQNRKFLVDLKQDELLALLSKLLNIDVLYALEKITAKDLIGEKKLLSVYAEDITKLQLIADESQDKYDGWKALCDKTRRKISDTQACIAVNAELLQKQHLMYSNAHIPANIIDEIAVQKKYITGFVMKSDKLKSAHVMRAEFNESHTLHRIRKSKLPDNYRDQDYTPVSNIIDDNTYSLYKKELKNGVVAKPLVSITPEIAQTRDAVARLVDPREIIRLESHLDKLETRLVFCGISPDNFLEISRKIHNIFHQNASPEIIEKKILELELLQRNSTEINIRELYGMLVAIPDRPSLVDPASFESGDRISVLESMTQSRMAVPDPPAVIDNIDESERVAREIIDTGLPDYGMISKTILELKKKQASFSFMYGKLAFGQDCVCCLANTKLLSELFDMESAEAKIHELELIIGLQDSATKRYITTKTILADITEYKTKRLSIDIAMKNNLLYDELIALRARANQASRYDEYQKKISQINDGLLFNMAINSRIDSAKLNNDAIADRGLLIRQMREYIAYTHNSIVNAEIADCIKQLETHSDNTELLKNIDSYILYNKFKLMDDACSNKHKHIIHELYMEISANQIVIDAESNYWSVYDIYIAYNKNLELLKIHNTNKKITAAIAQLVADNALLVLTLNKYTAELGRVTKLIDAHNANQLTLVELQQKTAVVADTINFLSKYRLVVSKTGISSNILTRVCGVLNTRCNAILNDIADFTLDIKYIKNEIKIYTSQSDMKIPASMASGYQKFVLDMIMRVVLTSTIFSSSITTIANPNILIIDEGFGCLDKQNFTEVAHVLTKLKKHFHAMIIITHLDELKSYSDDVLNIIKDKNLSHIACPAVTMDDDTRVFKLQLDRTSKQKTLAASRIAQNEQRAIAANEKALAKALAKSRIVNEKAALIRAKQLAKETAKLEKTAARNAAKAAKQATRAVR